MILKLLRRLLGRRSRTIQYPIEQPIIPAEFMGCPEADMNRCDRCDQCIASCPVSALDFVDEGLQLDLSLCVFCGECARVCPECIVMSDKFELASKSKEGLKVVFTYG